jgi:hypothetical protein
VLYTCGNVVFRTTDEGSTWDAISEDLTRNDAATMAPSGGPITKDNTGAENYGTVFTFAESPKKRGVLWAGSDDGLVHVSTDNGQSWDNVTPSNLPEWALISIIEPSGHDAAVAYLAATRYKHDDFQPYLYMTGDSGKTWRKITNGIPENDFTRVIREDPERPGLLFAGTETGIYVSYDDGAHWDRMGGNLPVVPVHDLVIIHDDLLIGTHGRSFWILDDVTLLRQLAAERGKSAAGTRLYHPRDARRFSRLEGFGSKPQPGQNYVFAAGMIPSYDYEKTPEGEEKRRFLDAGENPPAGVIVHYRLAEEPAGPITLTFLDAAGNELRSVEGKSAEAKAEEKKQEKDAFPPPEPDQEDPDEEPFVPRKPGLNRFVWDLRLPKATLIATKGGAKPDRTGPLVPPGEYQVRLTVDGERFTEKFRILPDPRTDISQADVEAQFALLKEIHEAHDALNRAVNEIRRLKSQAATWVRWSTNGDRPEKIGDAATKLKEKLDEIEGELIQLKIQSDQDELNYPVRLNNKLAALGWIVSIGDGAPTSQQRELFAELKGQLDRQLDQLRDAKSTDVAAFGKLVNEAGIPAVGIAE